MRFVNDVVYVKSNMLSHTVCTLHDWQSLRRDDWHNIERPSLRKTTGGCHVTNVLHDGHLLLTSLTTVSHSR